MWLNLTFPLLVTENLLAEALCVLIFPIVVLLLSFCCGLLDRSYKHNHVSAFKNRSFFRCAKIGASLRELSEKILTNVLMGHLASSELYHYTYSVSVGEEAARMINLGIEVVGVDEAGELNLLDLDRLLLLLGFFFFLISLEAVFSVIHDLANRRIGLCAHKYEIEIAAVRSLKSLRKRHYSELLAIVGYDADVLVIRKAYRFVDLMLFSVRVFNNGKTPPRINLVFEKQKSGQETILAATQNSANADVRSVERKGNVDLLTKASKGENGELCFFLLK